MPKITIELDPSVPVELGALRAVLDALCGTADVPCGLEGAERAAAVVSNWAAPAPDLSHIDYRADPVAAAAAALPEPDDEPQRLDDDQTASLAFGQPTAPAAPVLDSRGMPWDARIHSEARSTNADGSWRNKRGVEAAERSRIEAALLGQPEPVAPPPPAVHPTIAALVPPPPPVAELLSFAALMQEVTPLIVAGRVTLDGVAAVCAELGVPNVMALQSRPDLLPAALVKIRTAAGAV